jgi:PEP-CTERM motif-containing protein
MANRFCMGLLAALSLAPVNALADEISIRSGQIEFIWGQPAQSGPFVLAGDRGFSFQATDANLVFFATNCREDISSDPACIGGAPLDLTVALAPRGTATLDGVTYSDVGRDPSDPTTSLLEMNLVASATLPPLSSTATVDGRFFLDGPLNRFRFLAADSAIHTEPLVGSGIATLALRRHTSLDEWVLDRASFAFEPVPEPSTLLLVAGGGAAMLARHRRKPKRKYL